MLCKKITRTENLFCRQTYACYVEYKKHTHAHAHAHAYTRTHHAHARARTHTYVHTHTHKIHNMCAHKHCISIVRACIHTKTRTHSRALRSNVRAKFVYIKESATCFSWQEIVSTTFCSFRLCADMMIQYKSPPSFVRKQWGRVIVDCNLQSALLGSRFVRTATLLPCHLT